MHHSTNDSTSGAHEHSGRDARAVALLRATTVPLAVSGRFIAENGVRAPGAVKIIADGTTRAVLGIHMLGNYAPETIWGAAAVLESELTIDDLRQIVFPHPTVSEGIREAAWAVRD